MDHNCIEHLWIHVSDSVETHGLDCGPYEHVHQEWYECSVCGARYTLGEADRISLGQDSITEGTDGRKSK